MQAVKGFIDNGRFIPHERITLPKRAEVTLLFRESVQSLLREDEKAFWADFDRMTAESSNENELLNDEAFFRRASGRELITSFESGNPS